MTYDPRTPERALHTLEDFPPIPYDEPQGFVVPRCECGHMVGDHAAAVGNLNVWRGPCFMSGCGCREYRETGQTSTDDRRVP